MSIEQQIAGWHHDRNLIAGSTDIAQFSKLLEEVCELWCALNPGVELADLSSTFAEVYGKLFRKDVWGPLEVVPHEKATAAKIDAIGDIAVVLVNMAERSNITFKSCMAHAYDEIKDRKGQMIDGVFVKEDK